MNHKYCNELKLAFKDKTHSVSSLPASLRVVGKQVMTYEILQLYNLILKSYAVGIILIW